MKTISQKRQIYRWNTILDNFFSFYRVWQTSGNILLDSTMYYDNQCASYMNISVTPKRLSKIPIFEKKNACFPAKKVFRPIFSRIIDFEKPQRTKYGGLQSFVTVFVQVIRALLWDPRGRWEQVLKNRLSSRRKTILGDFRITEYGKQQATFC